MTFSLSNSSAVCVTHSMDHQGEVPLQLRFRSGYVTQNDVDFTYKPDPVILSVDSLKTFIRYRSLFDSQMKRTAFNTSTSVCVL